MPTDFESGPFLTIAALCEKALREVDGVLSLVRVIDRITHNVSGPKPEDELPALPLTMNLVIMLKAGEARGAHVLKVRPQPPDGPPLGENELPIMFSGSSESGVNLVITFTMVTSQEGTHWIDVLLDEQRITRIPLLVEYSFQTTGLQ